MKFDEPSGSDPALGKNCCKGHDWNGQNLNMDCALAELYQCLIIYFGWLYYYALRDLFCSLEMYSEIFTECFPLSVYVCEDRILDRDRKTEWMRQNVTIGEVG